MNKIISFLVVISVFIAVINFQPGRIRVFHLDDFIDWCEEVGEQAPPLWTELRTQSDAWDADFLNGLFAVFDVITFPFRFAAFVVSTFINFFDTFIFYNNLAWETGEGAEGGYLS